MEQVTTVTQHYGKQDLKDRLAAALTEAGLDGKLLSPLDLAPLDQFHAGGLSATVELAQAAGLRQGAAVLDLGSGLGGPSRYLAATFGCQVQGVDLSPAFVDAATFLAERAGLTGRVAYARADALALPYEAETFDVVWTQHVAMNIADRTGLYAEVFRVLRPGGRFAIFDVVAGPGGAPHYPVPWARGPETSFLLTPASMREALTRQGFRIVRWDDKTQAGVAWFAERRRDQDSPTGRPPPLGLHIAMGSGFAAMAANFGRNLQEVRVGLVQAVVERP